MAWGTKDVLRWNFAPLDKLVIAGIALAGFGVGCLDWSAAYSLRRAKRTMNRALALYRASGALTRWIDRVADDDAR